MKEHADLNTINKCIYSTVMVKLTTNQLKQTRTKVLEVMRSHRFYKGQGYNVAVMVTTRNSGFVLTVKKEGISKTYIQESWIVLSTV